MAIGHVVTRGYGNGTLAGTIADIVQRGYTAVGVPGPFVRNVALTGKTAALSATGKKPARTATGKETSYNLKGKL